MMKKIKKISELDSYLENIIIKLKNSNLDRFDLKWIHNKVKILLENHKPVHNKTLDELSNEIEDMFFNSLKKTILYKDDVEEIKKKEKDLLKISFEKRDKEFINYWVIRSILSMDLKKFILLFWTILLSIFFISFKCKKIKIIRNFKYYKYVIN